MRRFPIFLILFAAALPLRAQVATVEVSRPYDVNLDGIRKPVIPVAVDDSLHRFDIHFDYSIFNRPYGDLYDFTPYESVQLSTVGANRAPFVFARLGAQYAPGDKGVLPAGELYLQTKPRNGFCSGLYGRHNSSFFDGRYTGATDFPALHTARQENTVGGDLTYDWATGEMMIDVSYDFDRYDYALDPSGLAAEGDPARAAGHRNNSLSAAVNFNSAQKEASMVYYDVTFAYRRTGKKFGLESLSGLPAGRDSLTEGLLTVNGYVGATFDTHRMYVDMNIEYATYAGTHDFSIGVVEFSPIYRYQHKRLDARLGVTFGTRYGTPGEIPEPNLDLRAHNSIFPDVDVRYTLVKNALWVHAVVAGGNDLNPYSRMLEDCPIVLPSSRMEFGSRPVDATFSLEGVIGGRLGINVEGNYKLYSNKMIFVPVYDGTGLNQLTASYRDVNQYSVQGEVFWRSENLALGGRLRYARYADRDDGSVLTEMPSWTGYGFLRYNYRGRLISQIECNYRGKTGGTMAALSGDVIAPTYEVSPILDVDLNVNYMINKSFAVFAKVGNLLNRRNQYMPLYLEPGINFGGGICLNF